MSDQFQLFLQRRRDLIERVFSSFEPIHVFFFTVCTDYLSFVETLHAGLSATDADRAKYQGYVKEIGPRLHAMHLLAGQLRVVGDEGAMHLMQHYRVQAVKVNNMLRLELPAMQREQVNAVAQELFRARGRLYEELGKALKEEVSAERLVLRKADEPLICKAWSSLRAHLQEHSVGIIQGILGKAGLPIAMREYGETHKETVLEEADKLVSSMTNDERCRFTVGCIQEIMDFHLEKASGPTKDRARTDAYVLRNLRQILARLSSHNETHKPRNTGFRAMGS